MNDPRELTDLPSEETIRARIAAALPGVAARLARYLAEPRLEGPEYAGESPASDEDPD